MAGLRLLLRELATVEGHKSLVLLTEGLAVDDQNEIASIAALAGAARTSINVLVLDLHRGDITITATSPTEQADRRLQMMGLESLAVASLGSLFYISGTGEPIFERLSSEISAYYLLGVEERPSDSEGERHRIDVEVHRRGVTIRSRQAFVLSSAQQVKKSASPGDRLRDTLSSPFPVSGLPLRVTTFAHQDPASKVRLTIAAQVGQPGAAEGRLHARLHPHHRRRTASPAVPAARSRWRRSAPARTSRWCSKAPPSSIPASTRCGWPPSTTKGGGGAWCARCPPGRCRARSWRSAIW